jgi:hypothetical protein
MSSVDIDICMEKLLKGTMYLQTFFGQCTACLYISQLYYITFIKFVNYTNNVPLFHFSKFLIKFDF